MRDVRASSPSPEGERNAKRSRSFHEHDYDDPPIVVCQQPPFSEDTVAVAPTVGERVLTTALTPLPLGPDLPLHLLSESEQYISPPARAHPIRDSDGVLSTVQRHGADHEPQPGPSVMTPFANSTARDALLLYAYRLYESPQNPMVSGLTPVPLFTAALRARSAEEIYRSQLLPLLATLRSLHPRHIPALLLIGCVHHAIGEFDQAIETFQDILTIDSNYVEAMCNLGTTYKALNRLGEARDLWTTALERRPTYWDALDNLINSLLTKPVGVKGELKEQPSFASEQEALDICSRVLTRIVGHDGRLLLAIPSDQLPRLQRLRNTTASLRNATGGSGLLDLYGALELAIRPPSPYQDDECFTFRDLLLSTFVAGLLCYSRESNSELPVALLHGLGLGDNVKAAFSRITESDYDLMRAVHAHGHLDKLLLKEGGTMFPSMLLSPSQALYIPMVLFAGSMGCCPAVCSRLGTGVRLEPPSEAVRQGTHFSTAATLLRLAKHIQECPTGMIIQVPGFRHGLNADSSLLLLVYTLALALSPSAAIYNNLGLVLASIAPVVIVEPGGHHNVSKELALAQAYFERGLKLDESHPHLLTNLGSLLKDRGQVKDAIRFYMTAIQFKPNFDFALGNLGNALKDVGRPWDAIIYYQRALEVRKEFPEAICGLASTLSAVADWRGRGGTHSHVAINAEGYIIEGDQVQGWINDLLDVCRVQIAVPYSQNVGAVAAVHSLPVWLDVVRSSLSGSKNDRRLRKWKATLERFFSNFDRVHASVNEGGFLIRLFELLERHLQRKWYIDLYGPAAESEVQESSPSLEDSYSKYSRPILPLTVGPPPIPTVLPFHAFTCSELTPRAIRIISHRNALRISHLALKASWRPVHVYAPPPPPFQSKINVGYVSSDLNNHPLAHLMQSVFGLHNQDTFDIFVYATGAPSDGSTFRKKIETESAHFVDLSASPTKTVIERILQDRIHILVNLGGFTRDTRNDIFACRPCPLQISLMGFAGTLGTGWCDYLVGDPTCVPQELVASERWRKTQYAAGLTEPPNGDPDDQRVDFDATLDPESRSENWVYSEKLIYMPHTYLVTDHKQSFRADEGLSIEERKAVPPYALWRDEERRRYALRKDIFPNLSDDIFIFANFNQVYKICPTTFASWVKILQQVPSSVLWLLRFPAAGEEHLRRSAKAWGGDSVESRIIFTDVTEKDRHILRGRVADLFLDTSECSAHTVAADALWSGTPILTWPRHRHKMSSRVGASIACATGFGEQMVVSSAHEYETRAVELANSARYTYTTGPSGGKERRAHGTLINLRRNLFLNRDRMPLFDTARWTRNLEKGYKEAWRRWVEGTEFDGSEEWEQCDGPDKESGCIFVDDGKPYEPEIFEDE